MTDWLARKVRGVIDFSLPGDPAHLSPRVMNARIVEYYSQIKRHGEPRSAQAEPPAAPAAGKSPTQRPLI